MGSRSPPRPLHDGRAPTDSDLRATPQATLGLAGQSLLSVTAEGATRAGTTALPSATTTPPPTTTPPSSTPIVTAGAAVDDPAEDVAAGPTGSLAQTGTDPLVPVGLGLALVLVGAVVVVASRRGGAHA